MQVFGLKIVEKADMLVNGKKASLYKTVKAFRD
jgi:hypothetical protein